MASLHSLTLFFIILSCQSELHSALKILGIFPLTSSSHFLMYGGLMKELARRGHKVDVIGMFPQKKPIPNYKDINIKAHGPFFLANNMTYNEALEFRGLCVEHLLRICGTDACESLNNPNVQKVLKAKKGAYDVIVVELGFADCYIAIGQHLNAPVVGIISLTAVDWLLNPFGNSMNPSYIPSTFAHSSQYMTFWERLSNTLITHMVESQIRYHMDRQLEYVEKHFGRRLGTMKELYDEVSLVLINEHFSVNDIRPTTPDFIQVGGLHVANGDQQLSPDLQKWLDESTHGCVYFTFGSMVHFETSPEKLVRAFYEMFERIAPVRALIKVRYPEALLPGLPKNVKSAPWMPQVAILQHPNVKLFITHGGLMGTQEAIVYKVPMVGIPFFVDQPKNLASYVSKKIAICLDLDNITGDILTNAVKTVLNDPSYKKNVEKLSELFLDRPMSAMDTAVYWVEYVARHRPILKSPALKLTWWQLHLLDIYGFLTICLIIVLYIIRKIIMLLMRMILPGKNPKEISTLKKHE